MLFAVTRLALLRRATCTARSAARCREAAWLAARRCSGALLHARGPFTREGRRAMSGFARMLPEPRGQHCADSRSAQCSEGGASASGKNGLRRPLCGHAARCRCSESEKQRCNKTPALPIALAGIPVRRFKFSGKSARSSRRAGTSARPSPRCASNSTVRTDTFESEHRACLLQRPTVPIQAVLPRVAPRLLALTSPCLRPPIARASAPAVPRPLGLAGG